MKHILFVVAIMATLILASCDGKCDSKPDLMVPEYITDRVIVANESRYTVVGGYDYPLGTQVYLYNTTNEFYSVVRTNPFDGSPIVFYWNISSPPPFYANGTGPNRLLQPGEEVMVHRCVFNQTLPDFDCLTGNAQDSKTAMKVVVKVQNGSIVDQQDQTANTPSIPAGQYRVVAFPVTLNQYGTYELELKVNADNAVEESNTDNNVYVERPNQNLGGG